MDVILKAGARGRFELEVIGVSQEVKLAELKREECSDRNCCGMGSLKGGFSRWSG